MAISEIRIFDQYLGIDYSGAETPNLSPVA
jgi:hypothetical protein